MGLGVVSGLSEHWIEGSAWQALGLCSLLSMGTDLVFWGCRDGHDGRACFPEHPARAIIHLVIEIEAVPLCFPDSFKGLRMAG